MEMEQHIPAIPAEYNRMFYEQQARRTIDPTTRLMMHYRFLMMRNESIEVLGIDPGILRIITTAKDSLVYKLRKKWF